jgi:hypothetical protein
LFHRPKWAIRDIAVDGSLTIGRELPMSISVLVRDETAHDNSQVQFEVTTFTDPSRWWERYRAVTANGRMVTGTKEDVLR